MAGNDEITRVKYFDGEFLRAVDFQTEQTYERDARRRHVLAHHTWGIVVGLELVEVPISGQAQLVDVVLMPGMAIDGFGRELVCYTAIRLDPTAFAAYNTLEYLAVWLSYEEQEAGALGSDWADCQSSEATRITEGWTIVVTNTSPTTPTQDEIIVEGTAAVAAPAPNSTPASTPVIPADESVPYQELPESSPGNRWLVRLGTVCWDPAQHGFTTAGRRLLEERSYIGAVAGALYTPADTLTVAQRTAPAELDAAEFATIEGRLKVQGRIKAEKDVWIDGGMIHFAFANGEEQSVPITLGREEPAGGASGNVLRLRLGNKPEATTVLSIGPGDASDKTTTPTDIVRINGQDVVEVPEGTLTFDAKTRQMIDLYATGTEHQYGLGVQSDTPSTANAPATPTALYLRSDSSFRWFKGGTHDDSGTNGGAGAGGQLQLELDGEGNLQFGERLAQLLNLWKQKYGIGIQSATMYFRSDYDFCWYRGGSHSDIRDDPGGGSLAMKLDESSNLSLEGNLYFGQRLDQLLNLWNDEYGIGIQNWTMYSRSAGDFCWYRGGVPSGNRDDPGAGGTLAMKLDQSSNLYVAGDLELGGRAPSIIHVQCYPFAKQNKGLDEAAEWEEDVSGDFSEVFQAFVVLNGFSIWSNTDPQKFDHYDHDASVNAIPQHAYVTITSPPNATQIKMEAFCSESLESNEADNSILATLVVIGRKAP
jgi:hypothetical protein